MSGPHKPLTLDAIRKLRKPLRNANEAHLEKLTRLERFALWITKHIGSMGFFLIIFSWTVLWLTWNTLGPRSLRFDPYPAFVLRLFVSNMIQIFLMPLIMIGQNLQGRHAEARAESDFEVNVRAEKEIEVILMHLDHQNELILKILEKIEKDKAG
jgi:uncharacterized membrane protein